MHKDYAGLLLAEYPNAASYDDHKLILTGSLPKDFNGTVVDISNLGFNPNNHPAQMGLTTDELVAHVDYLRTVTPTGKLIVLSIPQGQWLHKNHTAFKEESTESVA